MDNTNSSLFSKCASWFESAAAREKGLIFWGVPLLIVVVSGLQFIEPYWLESKDLRVEEKRLRSNIQQTDGSISVISTELAQDPNKNVLSSIQQLEKRIAILNKASEAELSQLVQPSYMPILLEQIMAQTTNVTFTGLTSIAPTKVFTSSEEQESESVDLYQHGIQLRFTGNYFAARDFVFAVEDLGWRLYWNELEYTVNGYPEAEVMIELFTLSTSEEFISVL